VWAKVQTGPVECHRKAFGFIEILLEAQTHPNFSIICFHHFLIHSKDDLGLSWLASEWSIGTSDLHRLDRTSFAWRT
jgi:hypothetical protein